MAHKTFISYKYSEAQFTRDRIIRALGKEATYYQGETSDSPNLADYKTATIKDRLKAMIYSTSVTIVIISPKMRQSQWIPWEIQYSLYSVPRAGIISHTNGIVAVVQKNKGGYSWFANIKDGVKYYSEMAYVPNIILNNRYNVKLKKFKDEATKTYNSLWGSYISYVTEDDFIKKPHLYIDNAFEKSKKSGDYDIRKQI